MRHGHASEVDAHPPSGVAFVSTAAPLSSRPVSDDDRYRTAAAPSDVPAVETTSPTRDTPRPARARPSRWDRPPDPHDWRWAIGQLGRALITTGLMMFAFVGYQLWGTGIQEARSQDQLGQDFTAAINDVGTTTTSTTIAVADPNISVPPTITGPVDQPFPHLIAEGEVVAAIKIPAINLTKYVVAGVGIHDLRKGVGHFPNTPFPGQLGNAAIAGHRTTYGQPFYNLNKLRPGDDIGITTILGGTYVYVVTGSEEVGKNDYHVITDSDPNKATLTLITCTPVGTSSRRLVIHATLDLLRSSPVGKAVLFYGQTPPDSSSPDGLSGEPAVTTTTLAAAVSTLPTDSAAPVATTVPDKTSTFAAPTDAFNQGWFADTSAYLPVILWGLVLLGVAIASYRLAKRQRKLWLAFVAGAVPFVVVAYFFFENVNRLLPAAI